jgi:hypothetical protein
MLSLYTVRDMPEINLTSFIGKVENEDLLVIAGIVQHKGKNKGKLRRSKPKYDSKNQDRIKAISAYVWRMVAFYVSPIGQHHCMPVMADSYLPDPVDENGKVLSFRDDGWYDAHRAMIKKYDELADLVVDSIPPEKRYGVHRWAAIL